MKFFYMPFFAVCGVFSRYYLGLAVGKILGISFPYGTLLINIVGSLSIGIVHGCAVERGMISEDLRIGLMLGYLGTFTTFSAYCLEVVQLITSHRWGYAAIYVLLSSACGIGSAFLGMQIARWFAPL